jgi:predicted nicotinamide N-methyase
MLAELHFQRCERNTRLGTMKISDLCLEYKEKPGMALGSIVWSGTEYLCEHLINIKSQLHNKSVLELGCGLGLCSILAAKLGAKVLCTDKSDMIALAKENAELNNISLNITEYTWGESTLGCFDILIGSDIVYYDHYTNQLVQSLISNTSLNSIFILAYTHRHPSENSFFQMVSAYFHEVKKETKKNYEIITYIRIN